MKTSLYLVSENNQPQTTSEETWEVDTPMRPLDFDKPLSRAMLSKLSSAQRRSMLRIIADAENDELQLD